MERPAAGERNVKRGKASAKKSIIKRALRKVDRTLTKYRTRGRDYAASQVYQDIGSKSVVPEYVYEVLKRANTKSRLMKHRYIKGRWAKARDFAEENPYLTDIQKKIISMVISKR